MKNFKIMMAVAVVFMLLSCQQEDDFAVTAQPPSPPTDYTLTESEAVDIAKNAVMGLNGHGTRAAVGDGELTVKTIERVPETTRAGDESGEFFYVVNFNEGGYAVVPADERATDVYALSDEGSFDPDSHNGSRLFMNMAKDYLQYEISINDSLRGNLGLPGGGWTQFPTDPDDPRLYPVVDFGGKQCFRVVKKTQSEPFYMLETQWGQRYPYNQECRTKEGQTAVAGCVAVALGQIMAYHKQPQSYNGHTYYWDSMPKIYYDYDYSEEAYSVAYLINDIGKAVSMEYGVNGSGASSEKCPSALKKFGYTSNGFKNYDVSAVISSLNSKEPVYMSGSEKGASSGHAWVADGYYYYHENFIYYEVTSFNKVGEQSTINYYIHMNWGWDGEGKNYNDGYYLSEVFNPVDRGVETLYSERLKMITNIKYSN